MTDDLLYQSSITQGSYLNRILDCGPSNRWVEIALEYLPREVLDELKEGLAIITMAHRDGCRLAREVCENREVIVLSEHVLPKGPVSETDDDVRYFIYVVLHEIAHALKKHRPPNSFTSEERAAQEQEADSLAFGWFNSHVEARANPYLLPISQEEIESAQARSQAAMRERLHGD